MRKKRIKIIFSIIVCIIVLLGATAYYLIHPVKKVSAPSSVKYNSLSDFVNYKSQDILKSIQNNGTNDIPVYVTEDETNQLLELIKPDIKNASSALSGVTVIHMEYAPEQDYLYINAVYNKLITTQYIIRFIPEIVDNKIAIKIEDVKLGQIDLPKSIILKRLAGKSKDYTVNEKDGTIILNTDFPSALSLKTVNSGNNKLELHFGISLNSIKDLEGLMHLIPGK